MDTTKHHQKCWVNSNHHHKQQHFSTGGYCNDYLSNETTLYHSDPLVLFGGYRNDYHSSGCLILQIHQPYLFFIPSSHVRIQIHSRTLFLLFAFLHLSSSTFLVVYSRTCNLFLNQSSCNSADDGSQRRSYEW